MKKKTQETEGEGVCRSDIGDIACRMYSDKLELQKNISAYQSHLILMLTKMIHEPHVELLIIEATWQYPSEWQTRFEFGGKCDGFSIVGCTNTSAIQCAAFSNN